MPSSSQRSHHRRSKRRSMRSSSSPGGGSQQQNTSSSQLEGGGTGGPGSSSCRTPTRGTAESSTNTGTGSSSDEKRLLLAREVFSTTGGGRIATSHNVNASPTGGIGKSTANSGDKSKKKRIRTEEQEQQPQHDRKPSASGATAAQKKKKAVGEEPAVPEVDWIDELEQHFLTLLHLLSQTPERVATTAATIDDVNVELRQKDLVAEVYGSVRTGLCLPSSDIDCAVAPAKDAQAWEEEYSDEEADDDGRSSGRTPPPPARSPVVGSPTNSRGDPFVGLSSSFSRQKTLFGNKFAFSRKDRQRLYANELATVSGALRRSRNFDSILKISHAKVPIVKCRHRRSGVPVDFSFLPDGAQTSDFLIAKMQEPDLALARGLIVLTKWIISEAGLDDPSVGGLGSFPISLMVIWYLESDGASLPPEVARSYSRCFMGFLHYYGVSFDYKRIGIDVARRLTFNKPAIAQLHILNPLDCSRNAAGACTKFPHLVRPLFKQCYEDLLAATHKSGQCLANQRATRGVQDVGMVGSAGGRAGGAGGGFEYNGDVLRFFHNVFPNIAAKFSDADTAAARRALLVDKLAFTSGLRPPQPSSSQQHKWGPNLVYCGTAYH